MCPPDGLFLNCHSPRPGCCGRSACLAPGPTVTVLGLGDSSSLSGAAKTLLSSDNVSWKCERLCLPDKTGLCLSRCLRFPHLEHPPENADSALGVPGRTAGCGAAPRAAAHVEAVAGTAGHGGSCRQSRPPHAPGTLRARAGAQRAVCSCLGKARASAPSPLPRAAEAASGASQLAHPCLAIPLGLCGGSGSGRSLLPAGYPGPVACHPPRRGPPPSWPRGWPGPTALGLALSKRASRPAFQLLPALRSAAHKMPAPAASAGPLSPTTGRNWHPPGSSH